MTADKRKVDHHGVDITSSSRGRDLLVLRLFILILVGIPPIVIKFNMTPFRRGFFCDDQSIFYPYKENTIEYFTLICIFGSISICTILLTEVFHQLFTSKSVPVTANLKLTGGKLSLATIICESVKYLAYMLFGGLLNQTTTDFIKYSTGYLRPYFMDACKPSVNCSTIYQTTYIEEYICTGEQKFDISGRLSFCSGHTSFAFYCAMYLSIYIHQRISWHGVRALEDLAPSSWRYVLWRCLSCDFTKMVLQAVFFLFATWVACSRVSDYHHHPPDVLAGAALGSLVAFLTAYLLDLAKNSSDRKSLCQTAMFPPNINLTFGRGEECDDGGGQTSSLDYPQEYDLNIDDKFHLVRKEARPTADVDSTEVEKTDDACLVIQDLGTINVSMKHLKILIDVKEPHRCKSISIGPHNRLTHRTTAVLSASREKSRVIDQIPKGSGFHLECGQTELEKSGRYQAEECGVEGGYDGQKEKVVQGEGQDVNNVEEEIDSINEPDWDEA